MAEAIYRRFLAFVSRLPMWAGLLLWALSAYLFVALSIGAASLVFHAAFGGERGASCRGNVCYIEGPGGSSIEWVLKANNDRLADKRNVTRAFTGKSPAIALERYRNGGSWPVGVCASACVVAAAVLDGIGALEANPASVFCYCHDKTSGGPEMFKGQISARWWKLIKTGKPFRYADVR